MGVLSVKVIPNSGVNRIVGFKNEELVVKVKAQAEKGKANKELIKFLATFFGISKSMVTIVSGEKSHHKRIEIPLSMDIVVRKIAEIKS